MLRCSRPIVALCAAILGLAATASDRAGADWVNLTGAEVAPNIAEVRVEDDGVHVALEIFVGDLDKFADLMPRAWLSEAGQPVDPEAVRLGRFAVDGISVRVGAGAPIVPQLIRAEPRERTDRRSPFAGMIDPLSGRRLPAPPSDNRVLFVELFYPFGAARPAQITMSPPRNSAGDIVATIGMIASHRSVPVIDFRYFSGSVSLALDWDDPWYSRFDVPNFTRHHQYPRMAFLYAEAYEVRHEALIRVRDAATLVGLEPMGEELSDDEQARLVEATARVIADRSPMTVDGQAVTPDFDRAAFMRIGVRGLVLLDPGDPVDVNAAILGLIWSVPTDGLPKTASVEWSIFDEKAAEIPGYAIDAAGPFLSMLSEDEPTLTWTNYFTKPPVPPVEDIAAEPWHTVDLPGLSVVLSVASLVVFGLALRQIRTRHGWIGGVAAVVLVAVGVAAMPVGRIAIKRPALVPAELSQEQALALTNQLLSNVYRAFDFKGEAQVYDRLAKTIDGTLLEEVYLDQRRSLRIARAGGAQARVEQVSVESVSPTHVSGTAADFLLRTRWRIVGRVGHWGHVHQRTNEYEADLRISAESGTWKITGFDVLEQDRLS